MKNRKTSKKMASLAGKTLATSKDKTKRSLAGSVLSQAAQRPRCFSIYDAIKKWNKN